MTHWWDSRDGVTWSLSTISMSGISLVIWSLMSEGIVADTRIICGGDLAKRWKLTGLLLKYYGERVSSKLGLQFSRSLFWCNAWLKSSTKRTNFLIGILVSRTDTLRGRRSGQTHFPAKSGRKCCSLKKRKNVFPNSALYINDVGIHFSTIHTWNTSSCTLVTLYINQST